MSAVIEVTAGGTVTEPTYRFADASGSSVATFTADVTNGKITASGVLEGSDVQTTSGASLNGKMDAMSVDSTPTDGSSNLVNSNGVYDALNGKMDAMSVDSTPTDGSSNLVNSNGVYDALNGKMDAMSVDSTPTDGSSNLVNSNGVYDALSSKLGNAVMYSGVSISGAQIWGDGDPAFGIISRAGFDCSCLPGAAGTCNAGHCAHWFNGVWKEEVIPTMNTVMALVNSQSDERTKANWRTFENATAMINSLTKLGTFEFVGPGKIPLASLFHIVSSTPSRASHLPAGHEMWSNSTATQNRRQVGLSAQEVRMFLPGSVIEDQESGLLSVRYQDVFVVGLKATQELSERVRQQAEEITQLKAEYAQLVSRLALMDERIARLEAP